jgi:WD40 repeat protein
MIQAINADAPLALVPAEMQAPGCVYGMDLSADGQLLATVTTLGDIHIWDAADYTLLKTIRDTDEKNIDEYFVVRFTPDARCVYVAGKRKSRTRWDPRDDDNHVLPCHVKVFDVATGARVTQLVGHREEVLHIALVRCAGRNVALTGSQDGSIIAWEVSDDWRSVAQHKTLQDATSSMVFQLAPLPGTGCRYIVAAADSTLKVYDVVEGRKVAEFADLYTSFCDSVLVVDGDAAGVTTKGPKPGEWAVVTRGVEVVNDDDGLPSRDNTCALHILRAPTSATKSKEWMLTEVRRYTDLRFHANSYLCRIASNGRYLCAPTVTGAVYVWNIATGAKVAVLQPAANASAAQGREIRDIAFHATRPHLLTCGDGMPPPHIPHPIPSPIDVSPLFLPIPRRRVRARVPIGGRVAIKGVIVLIGVCMENQDWMHWCC